MELSNDVPGGGVSNTSTPSIHNNNNDASFYNQRNSSSQSFQQPTNSYLKTSSFADLLDLQTQLESQKRKREAAGQILKIIENDIANGKYNKDRQKRRAKRLEAQYELTTVNRNIMALERKVEAMKRIQAQEASHSNNTSSSFSYMKNSLKNSNNQAGNRTFDDGLFIPPNPIQNITFASAHSSNNSTPMLNEGEDGLRFDVASVLGQDGTGADGMLDEADSGSRKDSNYQSGGGSIWILSDILQSLGEKQEDEEFYITQSNKLVELLKQHPEIVSNLVFSTLGHRIQFLLLSQSKEVIACGYRIARYFITNIDSLREVKSLRIHYFLISSLSKSSEFTVEREQAIKLIRHYFDIDQGHAELSLGVVKTLATIVNSSDDELQGIITETLCELLLLNPKLVYEANGIKSIIKIITDGPPDMASMCGVILIKILDFPSSRKYLRNGEELGLIIYYFVNNFANVPDKSSTIGGFDKAAGAAKLPRTHLSTEKLHNSAFIISSFLKTWVGLSAFAVNDFEILRNLINCLSYEIPILRDVLMDIFFDILKIRSLPWLNNNSNTSMVAKRASQIIPNAANQNSLVLYFLPENNQVTIVNHYTAIVLAILIKCGLMEQISRIAQTSKDDINRRKSLLLATELFNYSVNLLPVALWRPYFQLSSLTVSGVIDFDNPVLTGKLAAQSTAFQIEKLTRKLYKNRTTYNVSPAIFQPYNAYYESVASVITSNIDDIQLRRMIDETRILFTKRFIDWKWDIIMEIIKGPLRIPKKFEDCLKNQYKFLKKMMSFYRPFKRKFLLIKKQKNYQKYINTGVALFETLLSHKEGTKFLSENKLLPQIAECLAQIDPVSGLYAENPIFSKTNLKTTLCSGYFKMLGVLSRSQVGLSLLRRWKIFSILHHIVHERGREDVILTFLPEFDLNLPSQFRVIFGHTLTSCDTSVRLFATEHLAKILKTSTSKSCSKWAFNLLINQFYDPDMEVCNIAVQILDAYCVEPENITEAVEYRPSLDQLGNIGAPLLLRFLSTSLGFNYLLEIDFIEKEMHDWFVRKNDLYVLEIEDLLNDEYRPFRRDFGADDHKSNEHGSASGNGTSANGNLDLQASSASDYVSNLGGKRKTLPHHFYGELVKTQSGMSLLQSTHHFQYFVDTIKQLATETHDEYNVLRLKGCLWAVGHIGSSELAISMVDESGIVQDIIEICRNTKIWSVKGTAFFVLGLFSNTNEGLEILDEFGWDVALDVNDNPISLCIPRGFSEYFHTDAVTPQEIVGGSKATSDVPLAHTPIPAIKKPEVKYANLFASDTVGSQNMDEDNDVYNTEQVQGGGSSGASVAVQKAKENQEPEVARDTSEPSLSNSVDMRIIHFVSNFGITSSGSIKQLTKLEAKYKERFASPDLYMAVMYMLENYSYKLSARNFILQLFADKKALENTIKRDRHKLRHNI